MINAEVHRPPLRYFGGKWLLAPWLISHFPEHRVYVEPYGGGASVLLRKARSYAEVYNDLDENIINVFHVLQNKDKATELERRVRLTPYSRKEFEYSHGDSTAEMDDVDRARRMIVRSLMGFGGRHLHCPNIKTSFRANSNRSGSHPSKDWVNYPKSIKKFTDRLMGVVIESRDAVDIINQHDSESTLFYVDPPYLPEVRQVKGNYRYEMTIKDHEKLLDCLKSVEGMVILSGYDNPLYNTLGWRTYEKKHLADGARERIEKIWMNESCHNHRNQGELF